MGSEMCIRDSLQGDVGSLSRQLEEDKIRILFSKITPVMAHRDAVEIGMLMSTLQKNSLYSLASEYYDED